MTFLETDRVEVITGVNLPMLIKLASLQSVAGPARGRARDARPRPQRHLGGLRPAARARKPHVQVLHDLAKRHRRESAGHARARGGEVRPPGDAVPVARSASRATAARWTARASWASCCWRRRAARRSRSRPTAPTSSEAVDALAALVESGLRRGRMQRLTGIGVSPGVVCGRAVILIQRAQVLRYQIAPRADRARAGAARARAGAGRASSCTTSARSVGAAPRTRAGVAVRRPAADARRPDARAARRRRSSASSGSTPSGRCSRCSTSSARSSTRSPIPTCASARATSPTWSAGCG